MTTPSPALNIIKSIAPVGHDQVRAYLANKDSVFHIDYLNSQIKDGVFVTYFSNINLPMDLDPTIEVPDEEIKSLLKAWMTSKNMKDVPRLRKLACSIMAAVYEVENFDDPSKLPTGLVSFIAENEELITKWILFMDFAISAIAANISHICNTGGESLTAENYDSIYKDAVRIDDADYIGKNFIYMFFEPGFMESIVSVWGEPPVRHYFPEQINTNCFKGKPLLSYLDESNNTLKNTMFMLLDDHEELIKLNALENV